ncbi:DUF4136 domain-containing protein [Croceitalea rosinachiae]|uniref:DUF4136 domain-containing protein n=1 Tax=Croceitalea rosinachiae TaxID=3075596 RepID=A0ABU3AG92_9FLAO|nr:DUF4136 domain-containing protein [Croceitalea sp. F388]MDT0607906.1 DUF4136 domain-containing protein [Croceitalea sp. F388]
MKNLIYIVFSFLLISCNTIRVDYDYDRATNFSNYTTYNYFSDIESGLSELDEKRLVKALDSTLQAKGYLLAEEPDFFINILSSEFRTASSNNVGIGVGGGGGNVGGGVSVGLPIGNSGWQRQIQFDFVDSQKDALYWQAVTESGFRDNASPSVREERLQALIVKVFKKFPPEK